MLQVEAEEHECLPLHTRFPVSSFKSKLNHAMIWIHAAKGESAGNVDPSTLCGLPTLRSMPRSLFELSCELDVFDGLCRRRPRPRRLY